MKRAVFTVTAFVGLAVAAAVAQPPQPGGAAPGTNPGAGEQGPPPGGPDLQGGPPPNAMFDAIDADGDGVLTTRELRRAAVALKQLDADQDGKISRAEATGGPAGNPTGDSAAMVDRVMKNDKNGDGKLTKNELPWRLAQMLDGADTNGDGAIDRAELTAAMEAAHNRSGGQRGGFGPGQGGSGGLGGDPRPGGPNLIQFDHNHDGQLSADEVPVQMRGMLRGADQDGNGVLDTQELQAFQQRMSERMRGQRPLPQGFGAGPQGTEKTPQ